MKALTHFLLTLYPPGQNPLAPARAQGGLEEDKGRRAQRRRSEANCCPSSWQASSVPLGALKGVTFSSSALLPDKKEHFFPNHNTVFRNPNSCKALPKAGYRLAAVAKWAHAHPGHPTATAGRQAACPPQQRPTSGTSYKRLPTPSSPESNGGTLTDTKERRLGPPHRASLSLASCLWPTQAPRSPSRER